MSNDKTEALLPCPFCGHDEPSFERLGTPRQSCIVVCGNCGCRHESSDEGDKCGRSWNERSALAAAPQAPAEQPTRSQKLHEAGFTPRDRRLTCDECGAKFTAQFAPLHECSPAAQPAKRVLHSFSSVQCERLIQAAVPGGDICDPQEIADNIRRYLNAWPAAQQEPQEPVGRVTGVHANFAAVDWIAGSRKRLRVGDYVYATQPQSAEPMQSLSAALQEADTIMGHDDSATEWRERWARLWPNVGNEGRR